MNTPSVPAPSPVVKPPRRTLKTAGGAYLAAALRYAERGWAVFPLGPRSKAPATAHGFKDATTDEEQIRAWWARTPDANLGVATGAPSGVVVVDLDGPTGEESWARFVLEHDGHSVTLTSRTGRADGGRHLWWRLDGDADAYRNATGILPGVDVRGTGGYVVVPPSLHDESGKAYRWERGSAEPAPMWPALADLLRKAPQEPADGPAWAPPAAWPDLEPEAVERAVAALRAAWPKPGEGKRHDATLALAGGLARSFPEPAAVGILRSVALRKGRAREPAEAVATSLARLAEGKPVSGWIELAAMIGEDAVTEARTALGLYHGGAERPPPPEDDDDPGFDVDFGELPDDVPEPPPAVKHDAAAEGEGVCTDVDSWEAGDAAANAAMDADAWRRKLLRGKPPKKGEAGAIKACGANVSLILAHHPAWHGVLGYDERAVRIVYLQAPPIGGGARVMREQDLVWIQRWFADTEGISPGLETIGASALGISTMRTFDPVAEWFKSLRWDGEERVGRWLATYAGAESNPYTDAVGQAWLVSAVARTFEPGCQADYVLVLEGDQGIGKSMLLRDLAGEWYASLSLDARDKDSALALHGPLIVEWSELAGLSKHVAETVKAFLTRATDRLRVPYGKIPEDLPRRCVIAGSTNAQGFLTDVSGNRRYWPVECGAIDREGMRRDRDQLWAEAVALYHRGARWWLDAETETLAAEQQRDSFENDVWLPRVRKILGTGGDLGGFDTITVAEVLDALDIKAKDQTPTLAHRVVRCLVPLGWYQSRPRAGTSGTSGTTGRPRQWNRPGLVPLVPPGTTADCTPSGTGETQ